MENIGDAMNKESSLERIRRAVDTLSKEMGFEKMTIRAICKEANVPNGVFYYHFKSKNALLFDRYVRTKEYFHALYEEKLQYMDPIAALQTYAEQSIQYLQSRVPEVLMTYLQVQVSEYNVWVRQYAGPMDGSGNIELPYLLFEKAVRDKVIETGYSVRQLCNIYFSLINGIHYSYALTNGAILADDTLIAYLKDWLESLRKSCI